MVDEELKGDWVDERDFDPDPLLFIDDEEASAPAPRRRARQPERRRPRVRRVRGGERAAADARRASPPSR